MGKEFLNRTPVVQELRSIEKWDFMKLENFCTAKETIIRVKSQPTEWENLYQLYI